LSQLLKHQERKRTMKSVKTTVALALMLLLSTGMIACKKSEEAVTPPAEQAAPAPEAAAPAAPEAAAPAAPEAAAPEAAAPEAAAPAAPEAAPAAK
jgi:biopolymer transport protein ExbB